MVVPRRRLPEMGRSFAVVVVDADIIRALTSSDKFIFVGSLVVVLIRFMFGKSKSLFFCFFAVVYLLGFMRLT